MPDQLYEWSCEVQRKRNFYGGRCPFDSSTKTLSPSVLTLTDKDFHPEGGEFKFTLKLSRPDTNIKTECSTTVTKAFVGDNQLPIKVSLEPESELFDSSSAHTFKCVQNQVDADSLVYTWEVIDVYKSVPMKKINTFKRANSFTIGRNTLKYDRSFIVSCTAESKDYIGHSTLKIRTPRQRSNINFSIGPTTFGIAGKT